MKFAYKITIEYNGKNFFGSQRQSSLRTVEKVFYETLKKIFVEEGFEITFSSRTDKGVHAIGNVLRLRTKVAVKTNKLLERINYLLPEDIKVKDIKKVNLNFNPRRDVRYRVYRYRIYNHKVPTVLWKDFVWNVSYDLDLNKMLKAKRILEKSKEFHFATTREYAKLSKSKICNLKIRIKKIDNFIEIVFMSNRFLHKMVRNLVSLLVEVARGKISLQNLEDIVATWEFCKISPAPAKGLVLEKIVY